MKNRECDICGEYGLAVPIDFSVGLPNGGAISTEAYVCRNCASSLLDDFDSIDHGVGETDGLD